MNSRIVHALVYVRVILCWIAHEVSHTHHVMTTVCTFILGWMYLWIRDLKAYVRRSDNTRSCWRAGGWHVWQMVLRVAFWTWYVAANYLPRANINDDVCDDILIIFYHYIADQYDQKCNVNGLIFFLVYHTISGKEYAACISFLFGKNIINLIWSQV